MMGVDLVRPLNASFLLSSAANDPLREPKGATGGVPACEPRRDAACEPRREFEREVRLKRH